MNDLRRELAPITENAWKEIEEEARSTLVNYLAGRKLVDFTGPKGWDFSAVNLGRYKELKKHPVAGVTSRLRTVQPLVELRIPFELSRDDLDCINRGAKDPELSNVSEAAKKLALAEDQMVFYGYSEAGIRGICEESPYKAVTNESRFKENPLILSEAMNVLKEAGVSGPYAIALSTEIYKTLAETLKDGNAVIRHVQRLIDDGPIIWAPALRGALLISLRGGDFELVVGRDISIGYYDHSMDKVTLYLQESLTFRTLGPEAAISVINNK